MSPGLTQWAQRRKESSHKNLSLPPHLSLQYTPYRADHQSPALRPWDLTMVVHPRGAPVSRGVSERNPYCPLYDNWRAAKSRLGR